MTTRKKAIVGTVSVVLLFGLISETRSCTLAEWERSRVKPGMSVSDVFHSIDGWNMCSGFYFNPATKEFTHFTAGHGETCRIRGNGDSDFHQVSQEELVQAVEKQKSEGQSLQIAFSYMESSPHATFVVDFDSDGKVQNVRDVHLGR
jgi:hypothetical protein